MKKIIITLFLVNALNASYPLDTIYSLLRHLRSQREEISIPQCFPKSKNYKTKAITDKTVEAQIAIGLFLMYQ